MVAHLLFSQRNISNVTEYSVRNWTYFNEIWTYIAIRSNVLMWMKVFTAPTEQVVMHKGWIYLGSLYCQCTHCTLGQGVGSCGHIHQLEGHLEIFPDCRFVWTYSTSGGPYGCFHHSEGHVECGHICLWSTVDSWVYTICQILARKMWIAWKWDNFVIQFEWKKYLCLSLKFH